MRADTTSNRKEINAKWAGTCLCGQYFGKGERITYDTTTRAVVRCFGCTPRPQASTSLRKGIDPMPQAQTTTTRLEPHQIKNALAQFTGTENWYRHNLMRRVLYTDGVAFLAESAGAYWLIDGVATHQLVPEIAREEFQVWKLNVEGSKATLVCEDGNDGVVHTKKIEFTDFPLDAITLFFANNVLYLPSEH